MPFSEAFFTSVGLKHTTNYNFNQIYILKDFFYTEGFCSYNILSLIYITEKIHIFMAVDGVFLSDLWNAKKTVPVQLIKSH